MDRQTVYPGAIPLETDILNTNRNVLVAFAKLASAALGTSTQVSGLACAPTAPASLQVTLGPGEIYSLQNLDGTAYSSLVADTTHQILKQGMLTDALALSCPAPAASGFSINYLIEATYQDVDANPVVLPYYNASNPAQAYSGPANSGTAQPTCRKGVCTVVVKPGVAATTGTQQTPAPDSGYVGLWVVTVAYGQTQITAANIAMAANAPFLPAGGIVPSVQANAFNYALDTGTTNVYAATYTPPVIQLADGMVLSFRAKSANTGGATFAPNGLPAKPIYSQAHTALGAGEIAANGFIEVAWNGALNGWVLCENTGGVAHGIATALGASSGFSSSMAANGWQRLPNGLIFQWCNTPGVNAGQSGSASFPIAFPNACLFASAAALASAANGNAGGVQAGNPSNTGCPLYNWGVISATAKLFAIGY